MSAESPVEPVTPAEEPGPAPASESEARPARARRGGSRRDKDRPPAGGTRGALEMVGLALFAFVVGLSVFNNVIMPRLIHSTAVVRVPDLSHLSYEEAEHALGSMQLQIVRSGERYEPLVPRGLILSQDPLPDTPVRVRGRVSVMVSLGEEYSQVPEMAGASLRTARLQIDQAGLGLAGITRAPSDEAREGSVATSDPPPGTVVRQSAPVGLLISTGPGDESFVMPNLLGRDLREVISQIETQGFKVAVPGRRRGSGAIIFQNPPPGSLVTRRATILVQAGESQR